MASLRQARSDPGEDRRSETSLQTGRPRLLRNRNLHLVHPWNAQHQHHARRNHRPWNPQHYPHTDRTRLGPGCPARAPAMARRAEIALPTSGFTNAAHEELWRNAMSRTGQLLKAARATANTVGQSLDNPSHAASLSYVDLVLNELILRDDPGFYLDHIARGELLLTEGHRMLSVGADPWIAPASLRPEMRADMSAEAINTALDQLNACLVDVVARLDEARSDAEKSYLERVCSWEKGFYDHHL